MRERILGIDHLLTAGAQEELASSLEAIGDMEGAVAAMEEGILARDRVHGPGKGGPTDVASLLRFADLLEKVGAGDRAEKIRRTASKIKGGRC